MSLAVDVPILGIATIAVAAAVGVGAAWLGGRLQRSNDVQNLALQLQIDSAAKFIGSASECISAYGLAWAPGTQNLTMTERQTPIFNAFVSVRSQAAAVEIVGPDGLADLARQFVERAQKEGMAPSFDPEVVRKLGALTQRFINEAKEELRPEAGQKNGRRWLPGRQAPAPPSAIDPGH
jgi:hypothetical protein